MTRLALALVSAAFLTSAVWLVVPADDQPPVDPADNEVWLSRAQFGGALMATTMGPEDRP